MADDGGGRSAAVDAPESRAAGSGDGDSDADGVMEAQAERLQRMLIAAMDQRLLQASEELAERDGAARQSEAARTRLALELADKQDKLRQLEKDRTSERSRIAQLEEDKASLLAQQRQLEHVLQTGEKQNRAILAQLQEARKELATNYDTAAALRALASAREADSRIQAQTTEFLKKELRRRQAAEQEQHSAHESLQSKLDKALRRNKDLEEELGAQIDETRIAQRALEKVSADASATQAATEKLMKQWQSALDAMSARDQALTAVERRREAEARRAKAIEQTKTELAEQVVALQAEAADATKGQARTARELARTSQLLVDATAEAKRVGGELAIVRTQVTRDEAKMAKLEASNASLSEERERLSLTVTQMRAEVQQLRKAKFETEQEAKRTEAAASESNKRVLDEAARKAHEDKIRDTHVQNLYVRAHAHATQLQQDLGDMESERDALKNKHDRLEREYAKLISESSSLIEKLVRKELHANRLEAKLANAHAREEPTQIELRGLHETVAEKDREHRRLLEQWKQQQLELVRASEARDDALERVAQLESQLHVSEDIHKRVAGELDDASRTSLEQAKLILELRNENRKQGLRVHKIEARLAEAESRNIDARAREEAAKVEGETAVQSLKHLVVQLRDDNARLKREAAGTGAARLMARADTATEKYDAIKSQLSAEQKLNAELTTQLTQMTRKFGESERLVKRLNNHVINSIGNSAGVELPAIASATPRKTAEGGATAGGRDKREAGTAKVIELLTLNNHRLKSTVAELQNKLGKRDAAEEQLLEDLGEARLTLERERAEAKRAQAVGAGGPTSLESRKMQIQIETATAVAASLEDQLRAAAPGTRIDYEYRIDVEPSAQLRAALCVGPPAAEPAPPAGAKPAGRTGGRRMVGPVKG